MPYGSAVPLLGIYLKKTKTLIQKDTCTPMFIESLFTIPKIQKQPKFPSTDEWIEKLCVCVCVYKIKYYSGIRKNEILSFATIWVDLESLCKISQTEKDKL